MTRPLKIFRYTLHRSSRDPVQKFYKGTRFEDCRQLDAVVATSTKKEAMALFGITASEANSYMSVSRADPDANQSAKLALSKPGQVFARPSHCWGDDAAYFEITREPHVVRPRVKRRPLSEIFAERDAREFTSEELEMIMERFAMSNDPMGQSIAAKAKRKIGV